MTSKILLEKKNKTPTYLRSTAILPRFSLLNFKVYNGKYLKKVKAGILLNFKKAGELAFTRKPYFFPIKKK